MTTAEFEVATGLNSTLDACFHGDAVHVGVADATMHRWGDQAE